MSNSSNTALNADALSVPFDPRHPAFRANPYPTYHRLRAVAPVYYRASHSDWILTRYDDVIAVLKDARFGHSESLISRGKPGLTNHPFLRYRQQSEYLLGLWILLRNPPAHTQLRQLFQRTFTQRTLKTLQARIQDKVDHLIDQIEGTDRMDIIHDVAYPLPVYVISEILGIPVEERHRSFKQWSHELSFALDTDITPSDHERGMWAFANFVQYFSDLIERWHVAPKSSGMLLDIMVQAMQNEQISRDEAIANCIILFFAGHTTIQYLIGNSMLALLHHPDQMHQLRSNPALIEEVVGECLRYDTPLQLTWRTALVDVEVGGQRIKEGEKVNLLLGAANRDPAHFPKPDVFDMHRANNKRDVAFGHGIHACLGARLAPLVAGLAINTLLRRLPNISLGTTRLEWEETFLVRGLKSLPVTFSRA